MKKNFLSIVIVFLIFIFAPAESFPVRVQDEIGRILNISSSPQRIISLAPGITEILCALNLADKIVGVTSFCDWPDAARLKPRVGGFVNPSVETIVSLQPDLIIATADGNRQETVRQLEKIGLTVYVINPSDVKGILAGIRRLGEITGREKAAFELIQGLKARLDKIAAQTRGKDKPRVFFQIGIDPIITVGSKTLINEAIELAGGANTSSRSNVRYPRYSAESIISAAPEIVLFAPMSGDREFTAVKNFWRKFPDVPAVKNNRLFPIETDLIGRASPRIIEAIEQMALIFHPEIKIK